MSTSDESVDCNEDWKTVYNGANSAPACLNNTIKSMKSCTTVSGFTQPPPAKIFINDKRINNQKLVTRVDNAGK